MSYRPLPSGLSHACGCVSAKPDPDALRELEFSAAFLLHLTRNAAILAVKLKPFSMGVAVTTVFLSYSTKDHYFAELAEIKLAEAGITLWRDQGQLRAGNDWRGGIERGISESVAVIVALSQNSAESSYVTFEWAYGLGKGKTIVPLKLESCPVHPRLEPIQYLDFSVPGVLPWNLLVEHIREIEAEATSQEDINAAASVPEAPPQDATVKAILAYLTQRGFQFVSYERIRQRIDPNLTDERLNEILKDNPTIFRPARLKGGKVGLKKLVP